MSSEFKRPVPELSDALCAPDASPDEQKLGLPSDFDMEHLSGFPELPDISPYLQSGSGEPTASQFSASELCDALSTLRPAAEELFTPPSTPRKVPTADRTCPLAPGNMPEIPILLKALKKNRLDLVMNALESDPGSAGIPFWDQGAEPPLCAAIRLGCGVDIVDALLKFGADVKTKNFASQNPLDLLHSATWRTVVSSDEMEELLLSAGAELSESSAKMSQEEEGVMMSGALHWDAFADAGTLHDFGLPPSLGSIGLFDIGPPPPVVRAA
jgi:hypothetical protein